jgi:hypothetical protein
MGKEIKKLKPNGKQKAKPDGYEFGRPTKYDPAYCQRMIDYFSVDIFKESTGFKKEKEFNRFPSFQGFSARELGVTTKTLLNWCEDYPDFLHAYNRCKELQEQMLVEAGLTKAYDSNFTKFILNSVSNTFKEKTTIDVTDEAKNFIKLAYNLPAKKEENE